MAKRSTEETGVHFGWRRVIAALALLYLVDGLILFVMSWFPELPFFLDLFVNATMLLGLATPLLYLLVMRPFLSNISELSRAREELSTSEAELEAEVEEKTEELQEVNDRLQVKVNELRTHLEETALLAEMTDMLWSCKEAKEAFELFGDFGRQLCPGTSGTLYHMAASGNYLEAVAGWGESSRAATVVAPEDCWALRRGNLYESHSSQEARTCNHLTGEEAEEREENFICVPLNSQGEAVGILHVAYPAESPQQGSGGTKIDSSSGPETESDHSEHMRGLVSMMADDVALALGSLMLREKLEKQSVRDPLTGLYNRRYMEDVLDREIQRAVRDDSHVAVVMLDIDEFKDFNDAHGHSAGDNVLQEIAKLFREGVRSVDIVCRYGGEEFTWVMPDASAEDAERRADQVRVAVENLVINYHGETLRSTSISAGVAAYPDHGADVESLIKKADEALYSAKEKGRNRVEVAVSESDVEPEGDEAVERSAAS